MNNKIEQWKSAKHGFDVWNDLLAYAKTSMPMKSIDSADLERMKWYGVYYRKRDNPSSYMLRIRLTGCELTATQAKEVAYIAYEYGYGIVDVTTRANIQIQGLAIENVPRALKRLESCGLTAKQTGHDNIRNVFGHPLSGVDPRELIEEVVQKYYSHHKAGQTFSAFWREKLKQSAVAKVGDRDYSPPVWLCEGCEYRHLGEDPPVYCPSCAGLRRLFARLEEGQDAAGMEVDPTAEQAPV